MCPPMMLQVATTSSSTAARPILSSEVSSWVRLLDLLLLQLTQTTAVSHLPGVCNWALAWTLNMAWLAPTVFIFRHHRSHCLGPGQTQLCWYYNDISRLELDGRPAGHPCAWLTFIKTVFVFVSHTEVRRCWESGVVNVLLEYYSLTRKKYLNVLNFF